MLQLLWILLPVAAVSGWWYAKRDFGRDRSETPAPSWPPEYYRGLNYLLAEQPDKAIEVFVRLLEVNRDTVEIHLLLASLFRRRGEVDRAIRIHQNLIERPDLAESDRRHAMMELAQDYMRAGLFDRAEELCRSILETHPDEAWALRILLDLYQQEKEWAQAIAAARQLASVTGERQDELIAQLHCELADAAWRHHDESTARQEIKKALSHDKQCARASLLQGEIFRAAREYKDAIKTLKRVEQQDARRVPEIVQPLVACYRGIGRLDELLDYLSELLQRHGHIGVAIARAELLREIHGTKAATAFLAAHMCGRPSLRGALRLVESGIAGEAEGGDVLEVCRGTLMRHLENQPLYRCHVCGFRSKTLYWRCPGCKQWNTVKPIYDIEGE